MHFPELHPDELLLGYIGRVARFNDVTRGKLQCAVHQRYGNTGWTGVHKTWSAPLAFALGISAPELLTRHTLEPLIRVNCKPIATSRVLPLNRNVLPAVKHAEVSVQRQKLRLCRSCVREDLDFWGYSYWRRSHQLPGVRWCLKHRCGLLDAHDHCAQDLFPEECQATVRGQLSYMWSSPVQRFAEVCVGLLEIEQRIPTRQSRYRMRERAMALGLRISLIGKRATISDRVAEQFPARWLAELIPSFRDNVTGQYLPAIDRVLRSGDSASVGSAFALVLTALYSDADEALRDIARPLSQEEAEDMALTALPRVAGARGTWLRQRAEGLRQKTRADAVPAEHRPWPFIQQETNTAGVSAG